MTQSNRRSGFGGELWQECERSGCRTQPACVNCFYCWRHCTCPAPAPEALDHDEKPASHHDEQPTSNPSASRTNAADAPHPALLTFECGGMAGERFPYPEWPELPGTEFRPTGAAAVISGTREQCLEWARLVWQACVADGTAPRMAWWHLVVQEIGWNNVQGYIHSQFVREVVGVDELVRVAREHVPTLHVNPPNVIDRHLNAKYHVGETYGLPINRLQPITNEALAAALETARGRRLRPRQAYSHNAEDIVDDYWVRNGTYGRGIDANGHIWTSTYQGEEMLDLTALAEQPVAIPVAEILDEPALEAIRGALGLQWISVYRLPDGSRRAWDSEGNAWHAVPDMDEDAERSGREAFRTAEQARQRRAEIARDEELIAEIRKAAKRSALADWEQFAILNVSDEVRRSERLDSTTTLSRVVVQDASADRLWEFFTVQWSWGCLGEDGETDEAFEVHENIAGAETAFARYEVL